LKLGIKCLIALVAVAMASFCVSASDTTTKFQTGPFTVSVDLGVPCTDVNISKPVSSEDLGGNSYTDYDTHMCKAQIWIRQWDKEARHSFDLNEAIFKSPVKIDLIRLGVDKDTIMLYDRTIDGRPGVAGRGYVPKSDELLCIAALPISTKSYCYIRVWGNETMMISALKTIHVTENT
jgi:hypothetical protein